jgi:hypothetical protein
MDDAEASELKIPRMWRAAAAVAGVLFVAAFIFAVGTGGPPSGVDPASDSEAIAAALVENRTGLVTGNYLLLLSALLLVVFSGYLRHTTATEEGDQWPLTVAFGGGLLAAGTLVLVALIGIAQGQIDTYAADTGVARALLTLGWNGVWMTAPGFAALLGGTTLVSFTYETLPRAIGFIGAVATIILVTPFWGIGLVMALIWITATSITLTIRELRTEDN